MKKLIFLLGVIVLFSCNDKVPIEVVPEPTLRVACKLKFGSEDLILNDSYTLTDGIKIQVTDCRFYLSDGNNAGAYLFPVALFDATSSQSFFYSVKNNKDNFSNLALNIGVSANDNHADPSAFDLANPLNIQIANDMHWSWNSGYIFIKIEGRADTIPNNTDLFDHNFVYHIGRDEHLLSKSFTGLLWNQVTTDVYQTNFAFDFKTFFENSASPLNVKSEFFTHTNPDQVNVTNKVKTNFLAAFYNF